MAIAADSIYTGGAMSGVTDSHDAFVPEIWGPAIELAFKEKLILGGLATDLSAFVANGGDKIRMPQIDTITSGDKTAEAAITWGTGAAVQTDLELDVDKHTYAACMIEDILNVTSSYDLVNIYAKELGYALAKSIDENIESKLLASCQASGGGINGIALSNDLGNVADFDTILGTVLVEDQDVANWNLVLHPTTFANLANLAQLSYGTSGSPLGQTFTNTGQVLNLFGMGVFVSPNVTNSATDMDSGGGTDTQTPIGYVVHKSALYTAFSRNVNLKTFYDIDYLGTKMVADVMYGCKVNSANTAGQKRVHFLI